MCTLSPLPCLSGTILYRRPALNMVVIDGGLVYDGDWGGRGGGVDMVIPVVII